MQLHARQAGASSGDVLPRTGACCADSARPLSTKRIFLFGDYLRFDWAPLLIVRCHFTCGQVHFEMASIDVYYGVV